jgi:hypothetical protein
MHVKPAPGVKVRKFHELGQAAKRGRAPAFLADGGEWVPRIVEWMRALKCGDVVLCTPPKKKATKTKKSEA